jgi:hypothetical protein
MIDIEHEHLVAIHDVPKLLPVRSNGKRIHISAVYRWVQRGVRGIHLEIVRVGGTSYTSREALQRFATSPMTAFPQPMQVTTSRQKQIESANRRVQELLHPRKSQFRG